MITWHPEKAYIYGIDYIKEEPNDKYILIKYSGIPVYKINRTSGALYLIKLEEFEKNWLIDSGIAIKEHEIEDNKIYTICAMSERENKNEM